MDSRYGELANRIGLGNSQRIPRLFELIADPSEAGPMLAMPGTVPELAQKLGRPEEEIEAMLKTLFVKGIAFPSAPASMSSSTHRSRPFLAAQSKAVYPSLSCMRTSALYFSCSGSWKQCKNSRVAVGEGKVRVRSLRHPLWQVFNLVLEGKDRLRPATVASLR